MKKVLMFLVVLATGFVLATPVLAKHRDHYRGHSARVVQGGYYADYYARYPRTRSHVSLFFGFGAPLFAPAPVYVYAPPPIIVGYGYYEPIWVPGHYRHQGRARVYIAGHWSR